MRKDTVERKARLLINKCNIKTPPVDIVIIANGLDVRVTKANLPDDISGVLQKNATGISTIMVNNEHAPVRQRFTIAHELGHYLLSDKTGVIIDQAIYFRDSRSQEAADYDEIVANTFAAELLMPTPFVKSAISRIISGGRLNARDDLIKMLADDFNVSTTAMSIKLQNLGYRFSVA